MSLVAVGSAKALGRCGAEALGWGERGSEPCAS